MTSNHVETLLKKAAETKESVQALQFSQAAVNAANAMFLMKELESKGHVG